MQPATHPSWRRPIDPYAVDVAKSTLDTEQEHHDSRICRDEASTLVTKFWSFGRESGRYGSPLLADDRALKVKVKVFGSFEV